MAGQELTPLGAEQEYRTVYESMLASVPVAFKVKEPVAESLTFAVPVADDNVNEVAKRTADALGTESNPIPIAATRPRASRLKNVFFDICFLSSVALETVPKSA
jgi:hypothetical protein